MQSVFFCVALSLGVLATMTASKKQFSIHMPGVTTSKEDAYMCTHTRVKEDTYITGFEPDADMHVAHHMLLFMCKHTFSRKKHYPCMSPCYEGKVVYAWARQAKGLKLPPRVAFEVGPASGYPYLVLQVHYLKQIRKPDTSGVTITTVPNPQPGVAGVLLMSVGEGKIPARSRDVRIYMACVYSTRTKIYPFAFRTHGHTLARTIFVEHISTKDGLRTRLLGRASPQWPQAFYDTASAAPISRGDVFLGACIYDSMQRNRATKIGSTHHDEMCNFYLMYYRMRGDPALTSMESEACGDGIDVSDDAFNKLHRLVPDSSFDYLPTNFSTSALRDALGVQTFNYGALEWLLKDEKVGQIGGVSIDSKGRLIVFHRGDRMWDGSTFNARNVLKEAYRREPIKQATILVVDVRSGTVVSRFGENMFYMPHGLTVDHEDNLWLTDVGSHQVYKLAISDSGKFKLVLGVKHKPGSDHHHFCKPTDVAVLKDGSFFVSDGYCNSRVMKFGKTGKLVGIIHSSDGDFDTPHSLTLSGQDRLCVADRERARIECFNTSTRKSLFTLKNNPAFGEAIYAITADPRYAGDILHGVVRNNDGPKGFTLSLKSRKVLALWGAKINLPHDLAATENYIFVADIAKPFRLVAFNYTAAGSDKVNHETSSLSLNMKSILPDNKTTYQSEGFMDLLSENTPFLVGMIIVLPLAIIVLGAAIIHLHRNGMCPCFCRHRRPGIRGDFNRGRFKPLLSDKDESDSEDNEDIYNIETVKQRYELKT